MVVILSSYVVILNEVPVLSLSKGRISHSNTERQEKQILRFAQDDRWGRSD